MMNEIKLIIQSTPNPNALKFVVNRAVKSEGNYTYKKADDTSTNPLVANIFQLNEAVKEVYFFDNYITVTQDGTADWDALEETIKATILANIADHNPDFETPQPKKTQTTTIASGPEIDQINAILDQTVRPALQMDGGDLQLAGYADNTLRIFYQGACGSCPSSTMGTMQAIENILKDQFNPDIKVELAEAF